MIAGFHAPLPPARTGVADYAAALLQALRRRGRVEVNPLRADVRLYHLGNNQLHRAIYEKALVEPGVAVLHDAVLQHFFLGSLEQASYAEEFVYNYGEWNRSLAAELWRCRSGSSLDGRYFEYPMLRRIAERSRAVVVHNPAAAQMVRQHAARATVLEIPHLFVPPELPPLAEQIRFRQSLGIPPCAFLWGIFGYLRESKRIPAVLRAFGRLRRVCPSAWLLVAGEFASSDLARAAGPLLEAPGICRLSFLPERDFWMASACVDGCINLRHPTAGETSGIAIRLMGIGRPVLVSDGLESSRYPEAACLRISSGLLEEDSLLDSMLLLTSVPDLAREIGLQAAAHVAAHHGIDRVADQYWKVLCEHCA